MASRHRATRRTPAALVVAGLAASALPAAVVAAAVPAHAATLEATVFAVVSEGLTPETAATLAQRAGIGNALRPDGSFGFVDEARFAALPATDVAKGVDESRRPTVSSALDLKALDAITVLPDSSALERAKGLLPVPAGYQATPVVGHTHVDRADGRGKVVQSKDIDTTVSYRLSLAGLPVVGPGAKSKISFGAKGEVLQLSRSVREVAAKGSVPVISPDEAQARCTALYGRGVAQGTPTLGYYAPPLSAEKASGKGAVSLVVPHYICQPADGSDKESLTGKLVPAAPSLSPTVKLAVSGDGRTVKGEAAATGGTGPYSFRWSSSTTTLDPAQASTTVGYQISDRAKSGAEQLTVVVTDANGLATTAAVTLPGAQGSASAVGNAGGLGGSFASNGIEQTVDEWQCAQDSANGYKSSMQGHGHSVSFDWRGASAFEKDFKDVTLGGWDSSYVDNVDAQWYTGHGSPGGFTFKSAVDDSTITPADARWGDRQLEWLQLESCQVLKDTNGSNDYFGRWGGAFRGLHLLNGFDTNAYCINGGTGGRFADYLFPATFLWWTTRPALTVQQAWASMANDLEPAGVKWRSISPATTGWVTNLGDHFWGQGSTGPDISPSSASNPLIGWVAVSGVA